MKKITLVFYGLFMSILVFAQRNVTVKVTDAKTGDPIPNVSVKVKNTNNGGSTNSQGIYEVLASTDAVLELSSIGYATKLVTLQGESEISVALEPTTVDLSDIVIVGTRGAPRAKLETP